MTRSSSQPASKLKSKLEKVLILFQAEVPTRSLDTDDWDALRVAVRLVFETESLGASVGRRTVTDRNLRVCDWSDSLEGAISFLSWVRVLASLVTGISYPSRVPLNAPALWRRHRVLAEKLLTPGCTPEKRLSALVELGGLEVTLWGQTWALEEKRLRAAATGRRPKRNR